VRIKGMAFDSPTTPVEAATWGQIKAVFSGR